MKRLILSTVDISLFSCNRFNKAENSILSNESGDLSSVENTAKEEVYEESKCLKVGVFANPKMDVSQFSPSYSQGVAQHLIFGQYGLLQIQKERNTNLGLKNLRILELSIVCKKMTERNIIL